MNWRWFVSGIEAVKGFQDDLAALAAAGLGFIFLADSLEGAQDVFDIVAADAIEEKVSGFIPN